MNEVNETEQKAKDLGPETLNPQEDNTRGDRQYDWHSWEQRARDTKRKFNNDETVNIKRSFVATWDGHDLRISKGSK